MNSNASAPDPHHYLDSALPKLPRLLQLLDRDPTSRTYGCFDRQFWHFRTMDFPSGMSQEFALPLAIAWRHPLENNPYHQEPRIREWVLASIDFARRFAHKDSSCDDYYPFERALGAVAFSLYAMAEAYPLVDGDRPELVEFLVKRARWTAAADESGVLTNHHAIAAAALHRVGTLAGDEDLVIAARAKAREVLAHQHEEGWYQEYDGFDPGYQTVTVDFLARYWKASGDDSVLPSLERACTLLERVQHPDGTFGGEYGSRNTYHCQPHGFELLAKRVPAAGRVADRFLGALAAGRRPKNDDDRLLGHHLYPYLWAWLDRDPRTSIPKPPPPERTVLAGTGLLIDRGADHLLLAGLKKGGPFRFYRGQRLVVNDSGLTLLTTDGTLYVPHRRHDATVTFDGETATSSGPFSKSQRELMTPFKNVVLRLLMLTVGRVARGLVRRLLQKRLITGSVDAPLRFERRFRFDKNGIEVVDVATNTADGESVAKAWFGVGQTSIYIAASQPWDQGWLHEWAPLEELPAALNATKRAEVTRRLETS